MVQLVKRLKICMYIIMKKCRYIECPEICGLIKYSAVKSTGQFGQRGDLEVCCPICLSLATGGYSNDALKWITRNCLLTPVDRMLASFMSM